MRLRFSTFVAVVVGLVGLFYAFFSAGMLFVEPDGEVIDLSHGHSNLYIVVTAVASSVCLFASCFIYRGQRWACRAASSGFVILALSLCGIFWWGWWSPVRGIDLVVVVCDRALPLLCLAAFLSHPFVVRGIESGRAQRSNQAMQRTAARPNA